MNEIEQKAIAVVGLGAIMPDAPDVSSFWRNMKEGKYSIREVPHDRWDPALYYDPDPRAPNKTYSKIGAWVSDFHFDPMKMGIPIPPKVLAAMDPAQQWAIAASHQALKDFGFPGRPLNQDRVAVILGNALAGEYHYHTSLRIRTPFYLRALETVPEFDSLPDAVRLAIQQGLQAEVERLVPEITEDTMPGELSNVIAGRVANVFNLRGANYVTDAACASSFAALQGAVHGLRSGQFDAVLTGGIDRNMGVEGFVKFCKIGALSPDGSRPYAEGANGFVMGEGAAVFLLKRLVDAERDGDRIYAVIRGIGGSSDGKGKGITAPNPVGQQIAIERAWQDAGLSPADATYIEGHGTSTRVGDIAELESMLRVMESFNLPPARILLGSVKSNIGHLKSAAGAAGLLKAISSVHHAEVPPNVNFERPNPAFDFDRIPFFVSREPRAWERPSDGWRRAGVSSFGFGGTNFHVVLEEYMPGLLSDRTKVFPSVKVEDASELAAVSVIDIPRGLFFASADRVEDLQAQVENALQDAKQGILPATSHPTPAALQRNERLALDYEDTADLAARLEKVLKAFRSGKEQMWRMLSAQGVFRGQGRPGKIVFMFPGQGSQYANMLRELAERYPVVAETFREADEVMEPLLGRKLTDYIFVDGDEEAIRQAELALRDTTITQPAVLTADVAMMRLLHQFGFHSEYVVGHSLGEYAALVTAGVLRFQDALQVVSSRGKEMSKVSLEDNGCMAAVSAPIDKVQRVLDTIEGYVVIANVNSPSQSVIAGNTLPVEQAIELCKAEGWEAGKIPVSHAFHTRVVAPANVPLRKVIARMEVKKPVLPVISNVTGEPYPPERDAVMDLMAEQLASPVQFVKTMERLYQENIRIYVEVGPKRVLSALANDNLKDKEDVTILYTNHPRKGAFPALNEAVCAMYAAGIVPNLTPQGGALEVEPSQGETASIAAAMPAQISVQDGRLPLTGSVVISGAGLGLPGKNSNVFSDENIDRILNGEIFIESLPEQEREKMLEKRVTRLVKRESGAEMVLIDDLDRTIKLAGLRGAFDLAEDFGVPADRLEVLDISTQLAIAAGIEALRDAGIPLVMRYRQTSTGSYLPGRWMLPQPLADETGVIFGSAFPGLDRMADETGKYYQYKGLKDQVELLKTVRVGIHANQKDLLADLDGRIEALENQLAKLNYHFDRRFIFRILNMGHSQFAEYIGARGPNTAVNAACATTTHAVAIAEDWIRSGRCRRVIVIAGDDVTGGPLTEWVGTGLLATGATTTEGQIEQAVLPFDRRRNGMIMGMGAAALVVESEDAVRERGMRAICEILGTQIANSAFHGTRLDVDHVSMVMQNLVAQAEDRFGIQRDEFAGKTMFMSHETYTPARGGSAAAEIRALRQTFGKHSSQVVIANTKGFTGHTMGVGIEDVVAAKALQTGRIPPIANIGSNFQPDPELGDLTLSQGGEYPLEYALRLGAGFGSQIAMLLLRKIPGVESRVEQDRYGRWLCAVAGYASADLETVQRTLRIRDDGPPSQPYFNSGWRLGQGPTQWAERPGERKVQDQRVAEPAPVQETEPPARPVESASDAPPAANEEQIQVYLLGLVSEKTGYPPEMLELELDLEADLGVDTVKQAELFVSIREHYHIPRRDDLRLSDYNTLAKVIQFVRESLPQDGASAPAAAPEKPTPQPGPNQQTIVDRLLVLVSEKTGYPVEMLELDLDLEADLGIDTVKQAELFVELREAYNIPRRDDLRLSDYNTLAKVAQFVRDSLPDAGVETSLAGVIPPVMDNTPVSAVPTVLQPTVEMPAETGSEASKTPQPPVGSSSMPTDAKEVEAFVLNLVAEKTGYPQEMLDVELDLEADLGIDTVKQAEMLALIREKFQIPRREDLRLTDYNSLAKVISFVRESLQEQVSAMEAAAPAESEDVQAEPGDWEIEEADSPGILRRVPVPVLRPRLDLCKPTAVVVDAGKRFVIVKDQSKVADSLARRLRGRKAEVLLIDPTKEDAGVQREWNLGGPVDGVFFLPALDLERPFPEMSIEEWKAALDQRARLLYALMRSLPGDVPLISATRMGGLHGYGEETSVAPLGGAVAGFTKAYAWEHRGTLVKVVDFTTTAHDREIAEMLLEETLRDPGVVEIGREGEQRFSISLMEQELPGENPAQLKKGSVFLVTGGAGGICVPIVADLARASQGVFYLTGRSPLPDHTDPDLQAFRRDPQSLKQELMNRAVAAGKKVTPAGIEKELAGLERAANILVVLDGVRQAGGRAEYVSCDVTDTSAVEGLVKQILGVESRLDVVIHAAGVEKSHMLPQKPPEEFEQVFSVKVDGFFALCKALQNTGAFPAVFVSFTSVAGRLGNAGQVDYSAANDLLCRLSLALSEQYPQTRFLALDWGAWAEVGMASRGSLPKLMERAGIEMLPPDQAAPMVRREILAGTHGEVLLAGSLGMLQRNRDRDGGLDLVLVNKALTEGEPSHVMLSSVTGLDLYNGIRLEVDLDPKEEPFLHDHAMNGIPVLPGVMGIEGFSIAANHIASVIGSNQGGYQVSRLEDVHFHAAFKFYRDEPRRVTWLAQVYRLGAGLQAYVTLESTQKQPPGVQEKLLHFSGIVHLQPRTLDSISPQVNPPSWRSGGEIHSDQIYKLFFHGPSFQVLDGVQRSGDTMLGRLRQELMPITSRQQTMLTAPLLIELCLQTAGVWDVGQRGKMSLPSSIERLNLYPIQPNGGRLFAEVSSVGSPEKSCFDARVVDEKGRVYLELFRYCTIDLPYDVEEGLIEPMRRLVACM